METRGLKFAGLELGSDKRTQIVCLKYFAQENKIFVDSIHDLKEFSLEKDGSDYVLIRFFREKEIEILGVDAPLSLPPCIECQLSCPGIENCKVPTVEWMRREYTEGKEVRSHKMFLPYGQRPVDLLLRKRWKNNFVDQEPGLSANRAPLAARMTYLKKHLRVKKLLEVNPKLSMVDLAHNFCVSERELRRYRSIEYGVESRIHILEELTRQIRGAPHLFLYNTEIAKIVENLAVFDALLCALMAVYDFENLLEEMPFSADWGGLAKVRHLPKTPRVNLEESY